MRVLLPLLFFLISTVPALAQTQACPQSLASARRLVLVTSKNVNTSQALVQRYTRARPDAPWQPEGGPASALVGRNGMAWGYPFRALARPDEPVKIEGDKRAPMGFYAIGSSFGFAPSSRRGYFRIGQGATCVDDPMHRAYNTITTRARVGNRVHGENMWRVPEYRHGMLVDYPSSRQARGGSCIFIHLWLPGKTGTGGCVALSEPELTGLQDFAQDGAVLAILPREALDRFKGCLPEF